MKKHPRLSMEKLRALFEREVVMCPCCGPVENVYAEIWSSQSNQLLGMQFIHQGPENGAVLIDQLEISEPDDQDITPLYYCSECHCSIDEWVPVTWYDAEEILGNEFWEEAN